MHRQAVPWLFRRVDGPEQAAFREAYLSKPDHVAFLAVTEEDAPVGVICVLLRPQSPAPIIQPAVVAEIDVLAVTARFRRRGIGKRLVEAALDWAKLAGASRTLLGVHEFNQSARAFWASLGFEILTYRIGTWSPTLERISTLQKAHVVNPEIERRLLGSDRELE